MTGRWFCPRPPPIKLTATVETPSSKHTSKQLLYNTQFIYMTTPKRRSWSWSYGNSTYDYLCNQYISPLTLWGQTTLRRCVLDTTLCDEFCQWLVPGQGFSPSTPLSSDRHDITELLLKMALYTINKQTNCHVVFFYMFLLYFGTVLPVWYVYFIFLLYFGTGMSVFL